MSASNECWGIEVGSGAVKAIRLRAEADGVSVLDYAIIPHKRPLSAPEIDQDEAVRVALGALANQVDFSGTSVAVSVPGHAAFARFAKLPPVDPKKVGEIVKYEAVQQIPFPLEEVEWDYQTFVNPDSPDVEVGIFAITRQRIMERLALYEEIGLVPDFVTLSPVAAYNALAYDLEFTEKTPGTVIVDVGTVSTDLIVADGGRVWIRTFPIGGHHFTEALVEQFKLSYPKAEKLKREGSGSKHAKHIFQAMRPVFADLAQDVQRSIGYYQSLHPDSELTRVIGIGSTFQLPGIRRFLKQQLQMNVYRLEEFKQLSVEGGRGAEFQAQAGTLCTAYGLALQGIGRAAMGANLMPAPVVRTAMWKRKTRWFAAAAGLSVLAGAAMFVRPALMQNQVAANPPDRVIQDAIRVKRDLQSDAGDLLSPAPVDYTPVNLKAVLQDREVYAHLLHDISQMLDQAEAHEYAREPDENGSGEPAFVIRGLKTEYITPQGTPPVSPLALLRGDDRARMFGQQQEQARGPRQIRVELRLTTTRSRSQQLMAASVSAWLRNNADRPGAPYRIVVPERAEPWELEQRDVREREEPTPRGRRARRAEEGEVVGERQPGQPLIAIDTGDLDQLAPLPPLPPLHDPERNEDRYKVTWTLELKPPRGQEGMQ